MYKDAFSTNVDDRMSRVSLDRLASVNNMEVLNHALIMSSDVLQLPHHFIHNAVHFLIAILLPKDLVVRRVFVIIVGNGSPR